MILFIKESPLRKIKTVKKNNKVGIKRQITSDTSDSNFTKDENIANIDEISSINASNVEKSYLDEIKNAVSYVKKVNTNNEIQATDFEISTTPKTADKNVIECCQKQEYLKTDADLAKTNENSGQFIEEETFEDAFDVVDLQSSILALTFQTKELKKILKQHENNKIKSRNIVAVKERRINQLRKCDNDDHIYVVG